METLILGFVLGLAAYPVIRSWIVWSEYRDASREAWLANETLRRLEQGDASDQAAGARRSEQD
ncbi:MAG: hypothetical protein ACRDHM_03930 [Actinomycetota bacterium]